MKNKAPFITGTVFSSFMLLMLIGCFCIYKNNSYIVPYDFMLFPVALIAVSLVFVLVKKMPSFLKCAVPIILCVISLGFYGLLILGGQQEFRSYNGVDEIQEYNMLLEGKADYELYLSPKIDLDKYGDFSDIAYYEYHFHAIFSDHANTAIAKYTEDNFNKAEKFIESEYTFADAPIKEDDPLPVFSYDGFDFRIAVDENTKSSYPKSIYLIGLNRSTSEIAYVSFHNSDLDGIYDFEVFISDYCGWQYIVKERSK